MYIILVILALAIIPSKRGGRGMGRGLTYLGVRAPREVTGARQIVQSFNWNTAVTHNLYANYH